MTDTYLAMVNSAPARRLAKTLGLPRPAMLRRHMPGAPLVPGPVLVLGSGAGADTVADVLPAWNLDVRRHAPDGEPLGAVLPVLDAVEHPYELAAPMLTLGSALRQLAPGGRIVSVSRPASSASGAAQAAVRQGIDGALRSVARELRSGSTANGVLLGQDAEVDSVSTLASLRFLLSGRSAFVDGQFITVGGSAGALPTDWERPLEGKTAVVTGAARGIGAEIAAVLSRGGAHVVVVDVPAAGELLMAVANRTGGTALQLDITRPDAGELMLRHARQRFGTLDIMVHNAGITRDKLLANMDATRWESVIGVNLSAQLRINEALLGSEHFAGNGRIVCLASTSGIAGNRGQSNYAASKAGVIGMVRSTGAALSGTGRTINAVAPGLIETEMTAKMPLLVREAARRLSSLQQGGLPVDVAEAVCFLASDGAAGINGEVLRVCGQNLAGA